MLQRLLSYDDELYGDGLWSRAQLEEMDSRFTAAVERAFELGLESRTAAAATVQAKSSLNGGRQRAEEAAIEAAWRYLRTNMDAGIDVSFAEVLARCPGVAPERVRAGFKRRFASWIGKVR